MDQKQMYSCPFASKKRAGKALFSLTTRGQLQFINTLQGVVLRIVCMFGIYKENEKPVTKGRSKTGYTEHSITFHSFQKFDLSIIHFRGKVALVAYLQKKRKKCWKCFYLI